MKKILLVEPQKSKKYHTPYPPLGLLKLSAYHKERKDEVRFVQGFSDDGFIPDTIYITSLFTYAYEPVHDVIRYYSERYKSSRIVVGGIYATLCSEHLKYTFKDRIDVYEGLINDVEDMMPDYSLVPDWDASILFSSRGCVRKCSFCSVPKIEPKYVAKESIKHLIYPGHKRIILWDNNFLASPYKNIIMDELEESKLIVDFNQGLDARYLDDETSVRLKKLKMQVVRLAYDSFSIRPYLSKAIDCLKRVGFRGRRIIVYCLYNHDDSPKNFLDRMKDLMEWGVAVYPMRFEPLEPRSKNTYISENWTAEELEMIARARRVIGFRGAFPPYEGLRRKIISAKDFNEAFKLRPERIKSKGIVK